MPNSNEYDYEKLHSRSYIESPVTAAEVARRTRCRCERRGDVAVEVERIEQYGRPLTLLNCVTCGRPVTGST